LKQRRLRSESKAKLLLSKRARNGENIVVLSLAKVALAHRICAARFLPIGSPQHVTMTI
jgi:hypothetical protein